MPRRHRTMSEDAMSRVHLMQRSTALPILWPAMLLLAVGAGTVQARQGDLSAPLEVSADASEYDERKGTQTLRGNVEISQGSLRIEADRVDVFLEQNQLDRITGVGEPISFQQENDAGQLVRGTASRIEYNAGSGVLILSGGATLEQPRQRLDSQRIVFDARAQKVSAEGDGDGGRVSIRIQPPPAAADQVDERIAPPAQSEGP